MDPGAQGGQRVRPGPAPNWGARGPLARDWQVEGRCHQPAITRQSQGPNRTPRVNTHNTPELHTYGRWKW